MEVSRSAVTHCKQSLVATEELRLDPQCSGSQSLSVEEVQDGSTGWSRCWQAQHQVSLKFLPKVRVSINCHSFIQDPASPSPPSPPQTSMFVRTMDQTTHSSSLELTGAFPRPGGCWLSTPIFPLGPSCCSCTAVVLLEHCGLATSP